MRLWSLHPRYLDAAGLTACWREGLLARRVLAGGTVGYRYHPQLLRFQACGDPLAAIDTYLQVVLAEASRRGYRFDGRKIGPADPGVRLFVTEGQLNFEAGHLKTKLERRAPQRIFELTEAAVVEPHPLFTVTPGGVETWEILK